MGSFFVMCLTWYVAKSAKPNFSGLSLAFLVLDKEKEHVSHSCFIAGQKFWPIEYFFWMSHSQVCWDGLG